MEPETRTCRACGEKPIDNFRKYLAYTYVNAKGISKDVYKWVCLICEKTKRAARYHADPEKSRAALLEWRRQHPELWKAAQQRHIDTHPAYLSDRTSANVRHQQKLRMIVLRHYGGENPICKCCGEPNVDVLVIDHTDGHGNAHRREIGRGVAACARWIIRNQFPDNFRVLCHNCNFSFSAHGFCRHGLSQDDLKTEPSTQS